VVLGDGTPVGVVEDLVAMPAHDLLVVRGEREYWIPAVEPILRRVDLDGGELCIDPPPGLLEL
jgi:16S rRNA processing protein RimM